MGRERLRGVCRQRRELRGRRRLRVTEDELRKALKSLREAGIDIVAIHSHMTGEEPRIIFFHYWGRGPAQSLAQSIQKALPAELGYRQNLVRV